MVVVVVVVVVILMGECKCGDERLLVINGNSRGWGLYGLPMGVTKGVVIKNVKVGGGIVVLIGGGRDDLDG